MWRTKDGYFVSSNFARDPQVLADETPKFDSHDLSGSANARRVRWEELIKQNQGQIDVEMAEQFLADHHDSYENKTQAGERSLCGHVDASGRGVRQWEWDPYFPGGAVQGKVTDSKLAEKMSLLARAGHPCGEDFLAKDFLDRHPEYLWEKPVLRDMKASPWTTFSSGQQPNHQLR